MPLVILTGDTLAAQTVRVLSDRVLPGPAANALDLRWATDDSLDVVTMAHGVVRFRIDDLSHSSSVAFAPQRGSCWTCSTLASSAQWTATAFHAGPIAWVGTKDAKGSVPFGAVLDVDLDHDRLLVLGSRRDDAGVWAPDGAIAWIGTLGAGLADLRPVHYSSSGPQAMIYGRCGFLNAGGARYFPDGSFMVVPGVEPGVFLYSAEGKLLRVWQTDKLGILDRCDLTDGASKLYLQNPEARFAWINGSRIVEEVLPLAAGPALVIREMKDGVTRWSMTILRQQGPPLQISLPFRITSDLGWIKADVRGNRIAFLLGSWGRWRKPPIETPDRLIVAELQP